MRLSVDDLIESKISHYEKDLALIFSSPMRALAEGDAMPRQLDLFDTSPYFSKSQVFNIASRLVSAQTAFDAPVFEPARRYMHEYFHQQCIDVKPLKANDLDELGDYIREVLEESDSNPVRIQIITQLKLLDDLPRMKATKDKILKILQSQDEPARAMDCIRSNGIQHHFVDKARFSYARTSIYSKSKGNSTVNLEQSSAFSVSQILHDTAHQIRELQGLPNVNAQIDLSLKIEEAILLADILEADAYVMGARLLKPLCLSDPDIQDYWEKIGTFHGPELEEYFDLTQYYIAQSSGSDTAELDTFFYYFQNCHRLRRIIHDEVINGYKALLAAPEHCVKSQTRRSTHIVKPNAGYPASYVDQGYANFGFILENLTLNKKPYLKDFLSEDDLGMRFFRKLYPDQEEDIVMLRRDLDRQKVWEQKKPDRAQEFFQHKRYSVQGNQWTRSSVDAIPAPF